MTTTIQSKMITLGLDEEQESELVGLVDETKEIVEETLILSFTLEDKLQAITKRLKAVE
ncbi:hypothetical protein [Pseudoalteromonas tetraodonis]|uniref:hypothetical protein n=1 Tax=Pseudoalteromonas tetraodonis TaxID=43659 RepID=UPI001FC99262|nr:hypothetical protein [Pseudoalteromonas tetraodonis]